LIHCGPGPDECLASPIMKPKYPILKVPHSWESPDPSLSGSVLSREFASFFRFQRAFSLLLSGGPGLSGVRETTLAAHPSSARAGSRSSSRLRTNAEGIVRIADTIPRPLKAGTQFAAFTARLSKPYPFKTPSRQVLFCKLPGSYPVAAGSRTAAGA